MNRKRQTWGFIILAAAFIAAASWRLFAPRAFISASPVPWDVILRLRCGGLASAVAAGACLGTSGLLLQALLRNPLASPFILGLSSGAGLGVALAAWMASAGFGFALAFGGVLPAAVGSLVSLLAVWMLGRRHGQIDPLSMVLAGVCLGTVASALTLLLESLLPPEARLPITTWMMGRIPELPPLDVLGLALFASVVGAIVSARLAGTMDVASVSDHEAASMGVRLSVLRSSLFTLSGVLAAIAVVLVGPIAFVGFVAPHIARMLLGSRHAPLAWAAPLAGATVLVAADALRQSLDFGAGRVPVGVLTALAGGPVFLILLRRSRLIGGAN
ncbi:MAG: iron ABC transporter permease [Phycisphaerales bacterium]|nr:iron ABC transporter permease [Phycisphaerales bacterium]